MNWGIVELLVKDSPTVVFDCVFDSSNAYNGDQRYRIKARVDATKDRKELFKKNRIGSQSYHIIKKGKEGGG